MGFIQSSFCPARSHQFAVRSAALLGSLGLVAVAHAADPTVSVKYGAGATELAPLKAGEKVFSNGNFVFKDVPSELDGLTFTRRPGGVKTRSEYRAERGATLYALITKNTGYINKMLDSGWTEVTDFSYGPKPEDTFTVLRRTFDRGGHAYFTVVAYSGAIFAGKNLKLDDSSGSDSGGDAPKPTAPTTAADNGSYSSAGDDKPIGTGPATRPAGRQATVRALEIYRTDTGMMLGQTSEATLTVTPGDKPHALGIGFSTKIGRDMGLARDEAVRYLRLKYPDWYASKAELSFEDKYVDHDGGSIGTALGVLVTSVIEGFAIDPNVAITGDISANGKVRGIGGIAAKLKGAIASKCTLTAVPTENYDQLVDAVIYNGPGLVTDTQVIGIGTLDDAVGVLRVDRSEKLADAIKQFAVVQLTLKNKPRPTRATQDALEAVVAACPDHLSARVLLASAQGKLPKTLSATASIYYTTLAAKPMLASLKERSASKLPQVPSGAIKAGVADLRKLRPMADPAVRPLIDAWVRFINAWSDVQQHTGSAEAAERARQGLLDEMAKESADADMMQKMLREGM